MGKERAPGLIIIDDEEGARETLADIFSEVPYDIRTFADGRSAISAIRRQPPQIVITDMLLPDMNGIDVLRMVKEINPDAAVILVTGHASLETAIDALNKGAYAYVLKPLNIDELKIITKKALREMRLSEQNKRLIDQLQLSNRDLEAVNKKLNILNQEIEALLHIVSHDLRGPLTNIEGFSAKLEKSYKSVAGKLSEIAGKLTDAETSQEAASLKDDLEQKGLTYLGFIRDGVNRMEVLISSFLALSRAGRKSGFTEVVDMNVLAGEISRVFRYQFEEKKITFQADPLPIIRCNRSEIAQVLSNLINNSINYMGEGTLREIHVGAQEYSDAFRFFVRDTGIGIDEKDFMEIFKPFRRLNEVEAKGEGIGLSIVRKIITALGGAIWIQSRKDSGTTFYFTVPKPQKKAKEENEN